MFMSTRYSKRSSETSTKIFSVNDSLAKLCEFLTCEFSCRKLITCKYKDFRITKIKFEQKTRLNNAIWRAWHIQFKQKKKARFLQFAAPFSDENAHSTSQAVILEGKYWKRRWDKVSREHKKWRRHLEDKLLRGVGLSKEQLEIEESESDSDVADLPRPRPAKNDPPSNEPGNSNSHDSLETLYAMYAFPDTLFSSVEKQDTQKKDQDLTLFKDSSGMIQPTLVPLNPCFDELMENFDFLFTDLGSSHIYQSTVNTDSPDLLLDQPTQTGAYVKDDQFLSDHNMKKRIEPCSGLDVTMLKSNGLGFEHGAVLDTPLDTVRNDVQEVVFPLPHRGRTPNQTVLRSPLSVNGMGLNTPDPEVSSFEELPPQLQAPNLTARVQAAMLSRQKPVSRNSSDPGLATLSKRSKKDTSPTVAKKARIRRNASNTSLPEIYESTVSKQESCKSLGDTTQPPRTSISSSEINTPHTVTILPKTANSPAMTSMLPNYSNSIVPSPSILTTPEIHRVSTGVSNEKGKQSSFHTYSPATGLSDDFGNKIRSSIHPVSVIAKVSPMSCTSQKAMLSSSQSTVGTPENALKGISSKPVFNPTENALHTNLQQPSSAVLPLSNDQQLLALSQLMQSVPAQSEEATLCYLQLLQQQLNIIMKQQQEQIQMKHQLQLQAEKMLQQQQQHNQLKLQTSGTDKPSTDSLQFIALTPSYPSQNIDVTQQQIVSACVANTNHSTKWTAINPIHVSVKNQQPSYIATTLSCRMKDSSSVKPLKMSDFMPASAPKIYNKNKSLVRKLHRLEDPHSSFYDSTKKPLQTILPATKVDFHHPAPTTLDSAMALVSLRHGNVAMLPGSDIRKISVSPEGSNEHPKYTDSSVQPRFNEDLLKQVTLLPSTQAVGSSPIYTSIMPKLGLMDVQSDRNVYNEHRRRSHLSAEQKRRGLIKSAFEELAIILPVNADDRPVKLSNAAILERTCEHILFLQQERASCDIRLNEVQQEIDVTRAAITDCQNKLPAAGVTIPRQGSDDIKKNFYAFCKEMIYINSKSWIFVVIMRPLFDSFNKCVSTKTVDDFLNSLWRWLDRHCGLPTLRPVVLDTLTKLSINTSVLDDPNCLNVLAASSLRNEDPTAITNMDTKESAHSTSSLTFASEREHPHWRI